MNRFGKTLAAVTTLGLLMNPRHLVSVLVGWIVLATGVSAVSAGSIHYGDFGSDFPSGVVIYTDVNEVSALDPAATATNSGLTDFNAVGVATESMPTKTRACHSPGLLRVKARAARG